MIQTYIVLETASSAECMSNVEYLFCMPRFNPQCKLFWFWFWFCPVMPAHHSVSRLLANGIASPTPTTGPHSCQTTLEPHWSTIPDWFPASHVVRPLQTIPSGLASQIIYYKYMLNGERCIESKPASMNASQSILPCELLNCDRSHVPFFHRASSNFAATSVPISV